MKGNAKIKNPRGTCEAINQSRDSDISMIKGGEISGGLRHMDNWGIDKGTNAIKALG